MKLTPAGRAWAERTEGHIPSVALHGVEHGWPAAFVEAAITIANEQGDEDLLEEIYGVERREPCVHGHFDCATVEGGVCANETYARRSGEQD